MKKQPNLIRASPCFRFFHFVGSRLEYWFVNLARLSTDADPRLFVNLQEMNFF